MGPGQGSTVPRLPMRGGLAPGRCRGASPQDRGEVTASQSGSTSVPRAATALITVLEANLLVSFSESTLSLSDTEQQLRAWPRGGEQSGAAT